MSCAQIRCSLLETSRKNSTHTHTQGITHITDNLVKLDSLIKTVSNNCTKLSGHALTLANSIGEYSVHNYVLNCCKLMHAMSMVEQVIT
jgi:hypothetical protein